MEATHAWRQGRSKEDKRTPLSKRRRVRVLTLRSGAEIVLRRKLQRLSTIREALLSELSGNDARLRFINTRLILSIGVNLILIKPSEDADPRRVTTTLETLQKMGFLKQEGSRGS